MRIKSERSENPGWLVRPWAAIQGGRQTTGISVRRSELKVQRWERLWFITFVWLKRSGHGHWAIELVECLVARPYRFTRGGLI